MVVESQFRKGWGDCGIKSVKGEKGKGAGGIFICEKRLANISVRACRAPSSRKPYASQRP